MTCDECRKDMGRPAEITERVVKIIMNLAFRILVIGFFIGFTICWIGLRVIG